MIIASIALELEVSFTTELINNLIKIRKIIMNAKESSTLGV